MVCRFFCVFELGVFEVYVGKVYLSCYLVWELKFFSFVGFWFV